MERYGEFGPYTEREMEVELQYDRNGTQVVAAADSIPPSKSDRELEIEMHYVPVLYFFTSPNKPGVRLYDQSPTGPLADFAGTPGIEEVDGEKVGTFEVPPRSAKEVMWDSRVNIPNKGTLERTRDGKVPVFTFIVSEEELESIRRQLRENEPDERGVIRIVVHNLYSEEEELRFYRELYYSDVLKQRTMSDPVVINDFDKYDNKSDSVGEQTSDLNVNNMEDYKNDENDIINDNVDYLQNQNDEYKDNIDNMFKDTPQEEIVNKKYYVDAEGMDTDLNANDDKEISDINLGDYLNKVPNKEDINNFDFDKDIDESEIFNKSPEKTNDDFNLGSIATDIDKKEMFNNDINPYVSSVEPVDIIKNSTDKNLENSVVSETTAPIDINNNPYKENMNTQINKTQVQDNLENTKELNKEELNELRNFLNNISAEDKSKFENNNINDFDPPTGFGL